MMKNKTLVKSKIVLEDNGTGLVIYLWKKIFWIFGYWYPFGSSSSLNKIPDGKLREINDNEVSRLLFNRFFSSENIKPNIQLSEDERLIQQALLEGRKIQDYLWQELSLLEKPYNPKEWEKVFQKRVDKISQLNMNYPSSKVELRKRILQQGALSILALRVLDKK